MTKKELADQIRLAREQAGLEQKELAEKIEIDRAGMNKIEQGKRSVSAIEARRISEVLGIDLRVLLQVPANTSNDFAIIADEWVKLPLPVAHAMRLLVVATTSSNEEFRAKMNAATATM